MAAAKERKTQKGRKIQKRRTSPNRRTTQSGSTSPSGRTTQSGRMSQSGRTSQSRRRHKSHGRRSPTKRRGPTKRQPAKKPKRSPSRGSSRPTPGGRLLSDQAQEVMADFVRNICNQVSSEAERLRQRSRHNVIGPEHVQAALRRVVPKLRWRPVANEASRNRD